MESKPSKLYRGLKINYDNIDSYDFVSADLIVNYEPLIDAQGRKTVTDGNEYGVYMSDNRSMVEAAYGNLHRDGLPLSNITINYERIFVPSVGVIYEIDTNGLDIKKPFITSNLKGLYNNGFQGNEWIADRVPASNCRVIRIRVGSDILHEQKDLDISDLTNIKETIKAELERRKYHLTCLVNEVEKIPASKRNMFGYSYIKILKEIYGDNGLAYVDVERLDTSSIQDLMTLLKIKLGRKEENSIDYASLMYIGSLEQRVSDTQSLIDELNKDQVRNAQDRSSFEERKKQEGKPYVTTRFDNYDKLISTILNIIDEEQKRNISNHEGR